MTYCSVFSGNMVLIELTIPDKGVVYVSVWYAHKCIFYIYTCIYKCVDHNIVNTAKEKCDKARVNKPEMRSK